MKDLTYANQFTPLAKYYEEMMEWPLRKRIETPSILKVLGDISNKSVLDYGCGPGCYSRLIKKAGAIKVTGYDLSEGMLTYANEMNSRQNSGIKYISEIKRERDLYDVILAVYVTPYAKNREELKNMLSEMASLLKIGGKLVTLPLNPSYNTNEDYYKKYGFTITQEKIRVDGDLLKLNFQDSEKIIPIEAFYWSHETLNKTLRSVGFGDICWHYMEASSPDNFLEDYVNSPHSLIIEAIKKS